jgi:hypothetical protein
MKKFKLIFLASTLVLTAILSTTAFSTHNQEKSPRLKCLESCQATHISCLANAKDSKGNSDPNKTSACNKALSDCNKGCPQNP